MANPVAVELYIDFDPLNFVPSIYPPPYTAVDAYVVAELYAAAPVQSISFDLNVWAGTATETGSFTPAIPTYQVQIVDNGITVFNPDCFDSWPVTLGYLPLLYLGNPGLIEIAPHELAGHSFVTCGDPGEVFDYCYVMYGGLGMEPLEVTELCGSPVEDLTWSAVKALFR
jgi:hypothetical protein